MRLTWIPPLVGAATVLSFAGTGPGLSPAVAAGGPVQEWSTAGSYTYSPPDGVNGALVVATGGGGAGTWTGYSPTPGALGGGGAVVTGYIPITQPGGQWTVAVGGGGSTGDVTDSGITGGGGGGSSGVYPGSAATSVIAGAGGGAGTSLSQSDAPGTGGSGGNADGSGQAGTGNDAGYGGSGGSGGAGQGTWEGKGSSGGNGTGGVGGSACCGGGGGSGPARGGGGGSASSHQLGGGGGGGYGGGASGGALPLFNDLGGGGGGGGSFAPTLPGFPDPVYESAAGAYNGADGSVLIATVAPAEDLTATPVANGSLQISWQEPTQYAGFDVTYRALVDGQPALMAPGTVDGLDPQETAQVTVVATAGSLTATTEPVAVVPAVAPIVTGALPAAGATSGNYSVTIAGADFLAPAAVAFNGNQATDVEVLSDSLLTATVPGGVAGPAEVVVTNTATGLSSPAADVFSYFVPGPPVVAPAIASVAVAGDPTVGADLVTQVTASGDPAPSLSYAWAAGPSASGPWTAIAGASAAGLVPGNAQLGQYLQVTVTASNGVDPAAEASAVTATPVAGQRAHVGDVGVTGTAELGESLSAVVHGLRGDPSPTVAYQWQVRIPSEWQSITGADSASFTPTAAQVDRRIRVQVTAANGVGSPAVTTSPATNAVRGTAPDVGTVAVTGVASVGGTLTARVTGVTGVPTPKLRYQWQVGAGGAGSWADIPGQDAATLRVPAAAAGASVRAVVKAVNGVDPRAWGISRASAVPAVPPAIGHVVVGGRPVIGRTLTAFAVDVTGAPLPTAVYLWQRRSGTGSWRTITAARRDTLTVRKAWYRDRLRVVVSAATVGADGARKFSAPTRKVASTRPAVTAVTPGRGTTAGGTKLRITGTGFMPGARVRLGDAQCGVTKLRSSQLTCRTAAHEHGRVKVVVRNSDRRHASIARGFRYVTT